MTGGAPAGGWTDDDVVAVFEGSPCEPHTSQEVADELGCARTTAYKRLQGLVESGPLETKKVGARGRVWWQPPGSDARRADPVDPERDGPIGSGGGPGEQLFRAVFEEAFDAMLIADDDGRYVDVNPAACELFGAPREELLGRTVADFAADGYDVETAWRDFLQSDLDRGLFPLVATDGDRRLVEFTATPEIRPGRHLSVLRDVTERRETERELERERERSQRYERTLAADAVVELGIRIDGDAVFGDAGGQGDVRCEFEGLVRAADGRALHYVTVDGTTAEVVGTMAATAPQVTDWRIVSDRERGALVELAMDPSPMTTLVAAGANARSLRVEDGVTSIVAEVGADADVQTLINRFERVYPAARVTAKRTLNRPIVTTRQYRDALVGRLTDRQTDALHAAYLAGYFEWPRDSQAATIASAMGVATSTWLRHVRLAEAKLVGWFVEELDF